MKRYRRILFAVLPAVLALVGALAWRLAGEGRSVEVRIPLPTLLAAGGVLVTLCVFVVLGARALADRLRHAVEADVDARHAVEHRDFLSRLDHELKNPLTAILAANASGAEDAPSIITAQARRMGVLVTDLRKLSDLASAPLELEDVDLEETARDAVDAAKAVVGDSREFAFVFPTAPWPLPHVRGDADLLYSAIQNVVMNAVKYSDEDARIEVRGMQTDRTVSIEVADTGIGIPDVDHEAVWSELARASNVMQRPGSGMGLPLVQLVFERHGGSVRLSSREGVGTSVVMSLPLPQPVSA